MKCIASFWSSAVGIVLLMLVAPVLSEFAFNFGPSEYGALMLLGPILGIVGTDGNSGVARFSFDIPELTDGFSLVAIAMGLFAVTEVIKSVNTSRVAPQEQGFSLRDQMPTREDWRRSIPAMLRGSAMGSFFGGLPGTSGGMATFLETATEKKISKHPEQFGRGAIEGIAGPAACNNAGVGTSFIPTLTLGIPGDAIMALMLAALIIQGIQPGPQVLTSRPELFWGLIVSFWIGNIFPVILNIPLIGRWVRLLSIPQPLLFPAIVLFTCIGVYSANNNVFDVWVLLGVGCRLSDAAGGLDLGVPAAPPAGRCATGPDGSRCLTAHLYVRTTEHVDMPVCITVVSHNAATFPGKEHPITGRSKSKEKSCATYLLKTRSAASCC